MTDAEQGLARLIPLTGSVRTAMEGYSLALELSKGDNVDLSSAETAVAKALDGKTTSLTRYGLILGKNATQEQVATAISQRWGGQALANTSTLDKLHATLGNVSAKLGTALLPDIDKVASKLEKWFSNQGNVNRVTGDAKKIIEETSSVASTLARDANKVADALGGWKNTLEILLAIKVGLVFSRWYGAISAVATAEAAASGEAKTLAAWLGALARIGPIIIPIGLAYFTEKYGAHNVIQAAGAGGIDATLGPSISSDQTITVNGKSYPIGTSASHTALRAAGYRGPLDNAAQEAQAAESLAKKAGINPKSATSLSSSTISQIESIVHHPPKLGITTPPGAFGGSYPPTGGAGTGTKGKKAHIISGSALIPAALNDEISSLADKAKNAVGESVVKDLKAERADVEKAIADVGTKLAGASPKQAAAINAELTVLTNKARDLHAAIKDAVASEDIQKAVTKFAGELNAEKAQNKTLTDKAALDASYSLKTKLSDIAATIVGDYGAIGSNLAQQQRTLLAERSWFTSQLAGADKTTTSKIKAQIAKINSELGNVSSAIQANLKSEADQLKQAVDQAAQHVSTTWSAVSSDIVQEFEKQTNDYVTNVLGPKYFQGGLSTPAEAQLASMQQQDQLDQLNASLAAASDPASKAAAQRAIAEYNLQAEATKERADADRDYAQAVQQYTDQRTVQEHKLSAALDVFGQGLQNNTTNLSGLNDLLAQYGIPNMAGLSDVAAQLYQTDFPSLSDAVSQLVPLLQQWISIMEQVTGSPPPGTPSPQGPGPDTSGTPSSIPRPGIPVLLARGGTVRVPGRYIGRDSVPSLLSPGETVIDRSLTRALEQFLLGGQGGSNTTVYATVLGATERQVGSAIEKLVTPAQRRVVSYRLRR